MKQPRVAPELRELHDAAQALLSHSGHPWASRLAAVLRRCRLRLKDGSGGYTIPLWWLGLDVIWIGRELAASGVHERSLHVLLHEAAHHCGAVLPEWKLWFRRWGGRFAMTDIYGPERNSADAITSAILESQRTDPAKDSRKQSS